MMHPGLFLRNLVTVYSFRIGNMKRLVFDFFDDKAIGSDEKESFRNAEVFRNYIKSLISKRKSDMA